MDIWKTVVDNLRATAFFLDNIVYSLIPRLYRLLLYLANVDLYSNSVSVRALMNRVYVLVGIFMLFKLAFSVMRYIIDPGSFSDQAKGFTSLIKRVMIALVLMVTIPWMFGKLYDVQGIIIENNILSNIILGTKEGDSATSLADSIERSAKDVQFLLFSPFFSISPKDNGSVIEGCAPTTKYPLANILGTYDMALAGEKEGDCLKNFENGMNENADVGDITLSDFYITGEGEDGDKRNFGKLNQLLAWQSDGIYVIDYKAIISTICGGYFVFLLLSFCMDVAARAIKLMFLQILSPIAVISSVDPTESSQNGKLTDWAKEVGTTFASLFLRLAVVFVVIQMIKIITETLLGSPNEIYYGNLGESATGSMNIFVFIFLVIGAFQFAKKVPELIEKAFGIKMSGELNLNPFKNPVVSGITGLGVGAVAGASAGLTAGIEAGAPVRGFLGGALTGMSKGLSEKPGLGMLGNLRRKSYKDMTGNEMRTFNPWQRLYGIGGEKKVSATKSHINKAREQLNRVNTRLNSVSYTNARRYEQLTGNGIDPTKGEFAKLMQKEDQINTYSENIASLNKQKEEFKKQGYGDHSSQIVDIDNQITQLNNAIQKATTEFNEIGNTVGITGTNDSNYTMVKDYRDNAKLEDNLRKEVGLIEKDISTLSDQKSQQETFYHIDSSPTQSVNEAIKNISDREEQYDNLINQ